MSVIGDVFPWLKLDKYHQRLEVCITCPSYENRICKNCGCFMPAKAMIPFTSCPNNLWETIKVTKEEAQVDKPEWFDELSK